MSKSGWLRRASSAIIKPVQGYLRKKYLQRLVTQQAIVQHSPLANLNRIEKLVQSARFYNEPFDKSTDLDAEIKKTTGSHFLKSSRSLLSCVIDEQLNLKRKKLDPNKIVLLSDFKTRSKELTVDELEDAIIFLKSL